MEETSQPATWTSGSTALDTPDLDREAEHQRELDRNLEATIDHWLFDRFGPRGELGRAFLIGTPVTIALWLAIATLAFWLAR